MILDGQFANQRFTQEDQSEERSELSLLRSEEAAAWRELLRAEEQLRVVTERHSVATRKLYDYIEENGQ